MQTTQFDHRGRWRQGKKAAGYLKFPFALNRNVPEGHLRNLTSCFSEAMLAGADLLFLVLYVGHGQSGQYSPLRPTLRSCEGTVI